jgi:ABC-type Mn2+/Zn2+ transport system ATPase subunit
MHPSYLPYFLSLTLSNVRCFAEPQTLRLSRPDGRPARFTFLLGENGTGKTTVLQMLAHLRPSDEALHPIDGPVILDLARSSVPWAPRSTEGDAIAWRGELTVGFATGIDALSPVR